MNGDKDNEINWHYLLPHILILDKRLYFPFLGYINLFSLTRSCICLENDNDWMNNKYATAVMMVEHQQNNFALANYDRDRTLFAQHDNNCLQHHVYQDRSSYNEVPTSSLGYINNNQVNVCAMLTKNEIIQNLCNLDGINLCWLDNFAKTSDILFKCNTWTTTT